jgi:hypothetical protein
MAEVHEVRTARRGRVWPAVVMLLIVLLLVGIIVAMIMNIRGSISWPAGGLEFGFRPHFSVTRIDTLATAAPPITLATDTPAVSDGAGSAIAPADSAAESESVQPDATPQNEPSATVPPEIAPQPVN